MRSLKFRVHHHDNQNYTLIYRNTKIKKIIIALLICLLNYTPGLFSQDKDSLEQVQEMQRLNRLGDSLHRVQLARDSAFREQMEESLRSVKRSIEDAKQKEVEQGTQQVLKQYEREQWVKRRTMLLATSAFLIALAIGGMIFRRRKLKDK